MDTELEKWTKNFIEDVTRCIRMKSILQRVNFTCEIFENLVEISVFPAPVEHKGQIYYPEFEFSIQNMIAKFSKISNISWAESHLSMEGEYSGHAVWFKLFPKEPKEIGKIVVSLN